MPSVQSPPNVNRDANFASSWNKPFLKIGHGGAAGHAPANSLSSLRLALEMGVDIVEFDVRPCRDALVLLHDDNLKRFNNPGRLVSQATLAELREMETRPDYQVATLTEALDILQGRALINIDLKAAGYESEVLETVSTYGLLGDVIFSSVIPSSLHHVRQVEPRAFIGLSYPEDRGDASSRPYLQPVVNSVVAVMRLTLPYRILAMMSNANANAVMLYHKVVSRPAIQAVQGAGGKVFTWTVDDQERMCALINLGVNGIATNHPDLFNSVHNGS